MAWLHETVAEAVRAAEQHESMKKVLREVRAAVESRFQLASVQVRGLFWGAGGQVKREGSKEARCAACLCPALSTTAQQENKGSVRGGLESRRAALRCAEPPAVLGVQVGGEFAVSMAEQRRQIEALKTLEGCLESLCAEDPNRFEGLSIRCAGSGACVALAWQAGWLAGAMRAFAWWSGLCVEEM